MLDDAPETERTTATKPKVEKPRLYKVILLNDDYTPRDFVTMVLRAIFRIPTDTAHRLMMTAHRMGSCVITVATREIAEEKAKEGTDLAKSEGYPLMFTAEPEE
ncbi:ATP-dependent Clp protease adaptor ClpS [Notoacmeibacter sp. MSK16QG-6]|uniref:ATP-dependent Clp protease adaptor ClpS n=1 Tax=Notoacmeibacter sp. MSK16QG-6 TaxID=2957982 RepID=UPI00353150E5